MQQFIRHVALRPIFAVMLFVLLPGCNWFKGLAFILPEPQKKVSAEFSKLHGSVSVVVWAMPETLYDYPHVRLELASHIIDLLLANVPGLKSTDVLTVENYLEKNTYNTVDPEKAGREFGSRFVLYLELLEFSLRDPSTPELVQGHIRSSIAIYDLTTPDAPAQRTELTPVDVLFPPSRPIPYSQTAAREVQKALYETFAGEVVRKFHDHQVAQ